MSTQTIDSDAITSNPARRPGESPRQQSVCIEIPVTVHGSRPASGNPNSTQTGKTFVEETRTMIVFPQGAVLRLSENVSEGQILILKNPRMKQEVACRVVSSKTNTTAKGYVEVEFFQATAGFWGITFPSGHSTPLSDTPANEQPARQPHVEPAPARAVFSTSPMAAPAAPAPISDMPPTPAPASSAAPVAPPARVPIASQTLELNRAIVAAYAAAHEAPSKAAPVEKLKVEEKGELSAKPTPVAERLAEAVPVVAAPVVPAPALVAETPRVSESPRVSEPARVSEPLRVPEPKISNLPLNGKPFKSEKPKTDVKPLGVSKDVVISSTPVVTADSIGQAETEFAGYGGARRSMKQGLSSSAIATIPAEARKADSTSESKAIEPAFGRHLQQLQTADSESTSKSSGRTWLVVGLAATVLLAAGAGAYWWHTQARVVGAKSVLNIPSSVSTDPSLTTSPLQTEASAINPQTNPNGSPSSQTPVAGQKNNSIASSASGSSATATKPAKTVPVAGERHPNILPSRIVAPTAPASNTSKTALEPAPVVIGRTPVMQNASLGSMLPGMGQPGSGPAPPPMPKPSGPPPAVSVVQQPKLLEAVQPIYPKQALIRGDAGDVTIDALVDKYGKVVSTKVLTGPITLREAAVAAVSQQRYTPARLNGVPTSAHVMITITFRKKT